MTISFLIPLSFPRVSITFPNSEKFILPSFKIYKDNYKDNDKGDFGFTVDGGTEIKGTYIDNDHGLTGSNFDLTQHDF